MLKIDESDSQWIKLNEIDLFSKTKKIPLKNASPAQILEHILKECWRLETHDKDMIVMYHEFKYVNQSSIENKIISTMGCIGEDSTYTAMAKTVGLPLAIACLLILNKEINLKGIQTPINKEIYDPVLKELENFGIFFNEK
jgi:saccharopine dehydrogenase-like NADP-dependent oxidoreductase